MTRKRRGIPRVEGFSELHDVVASAIRRIGREPSVGAIVGAHEVPFPAILRDGAGTYYFARVVTGPILQQASMRGQVVKGARVWAWGDLNSFPWFKRGVFEVVALDVAGDASADTIASLITAYELSLIHI